MDNLPPQNKTIINESAACRISNWCGGMEISQWWDHRATYPNVIQERPVWIIPFEERTLHHPQWYATKLYWNWTFLLSRVWPWWATLDEVLWGWQGHDGLVLLSLLRDWLLPCYYCVTQCNWHLQIHAQTLIFAKTLIFGETVKSS